MARLSVEGTLWGMLLLAGCAESAIQPDKSLSWEGDPSAVLPDGSTGLADASDLDADLSATDAGGNSDGGVDMDASPDLTDDDASTAPGDASAGRDAAADAGRTDAAIADATVVVPDASAPPDAGPEACPTGTERCDTECVDLNSVSEHCGSCANQCTTAQVCTAGACANPPPTAAGCVSKSYGGHNYLFCADNPDDWVDARRTCIKAGLDLSVVDDSAENDFIKANNGGKAIWIGASDRDTEGTFLTVKRGDTNSTKGSAIVYKNWGDGEPNNEQDCLVLGLICVGDEDCAQQRADGFWNDSKCANTSSFVCESY